MSGVQRPAVALIHRGSPVGHIPRLRNCDETSRSCRTGLHNAGSKIGDKSLKGTSEASHSSPTPDSFPTAGIVKRCHSGAWSLAWMSRCCPHKTPLLALQRLLQQRPHIVFRQWMHDECPDLRQPGIPRLDRVPTMTGHGQSPLILALGRVIQGPSRALINVSAFTSTSGPSHTERSGRRVPRPSPKS